MYEVSAVIVAAGESKRFGQNKVFLKVGEKYLVQYSLDVFAAVEEVKEIILVVRREFLELAESFKAIYPKITQVIEGGHERQDSVLHGLSCAKYPYVLIHDGARPNISVALINRVIQGFSSSDAVVPVIPVRDTLVYFEDQFFNKPINRDGLFAVQTPQGYKKSLILEALNKSDKNYTDESTLLFDTLGVRAKGVEGSFANFKITYPEDFELFQRILGGNMDLRVGIGFDSHRLERGRKLILGGVQVQSDFGAVAHSDGDCLVHAIIDALLGGTGQKDIGTQFPDTDPKYSGISSLKLLQEIWDGIRQQYEILNLDTVVKLEKPKIKDNVDEMKENIARILSIPLDRISIKAKTGEKIGPVGECLLIECEAVVLLRRRY
ncbi:MAG: 2-C-methyl-D-erythritol 4-phosphate cytidylyltransferase [candidate division WOR-3 bacterium]